MGTVETLRYDQGTAGREYLIGDIAVRQMFFGDSIQTVSLAPGEYLVPKTKRIRVAYHDQGRVFLAPGDRILVAAQVSPLTDVYRISFIRFLEAAFEERAQHPLRQTGLGAPPESLWEDPSLSVGERYSLFQREFEADSLSLQEQIDDLVSFYIESWFHNKYRWGHEWPWRQRLPMFGMRDAPK